MVPADIRDRLSFRMEKAFIHAFNRHDLKYKPLEPTELIDRSRAEMAVLSHLVSVCGDEETARVVLALIPDEGLDFFACMAAETMASQIKTGLAPSIRSQWVVDTSGPTPEPSSSDSRGRS